MKIPESGRYVLANASVPRAFVEAPGESEIALLDILIEDGRIAAIAPAGSLTGDAVALDRGMVWPCFVDLHTHLDKGQTWPRASNPDGTRAGALATVGADRAAHWHSEDIRARMDFMLRCAYAHGTRAIRTHIDSIGVQPWISWPVFCDMRDRWKGRIDLQAVALFHPEAAADDQWLGRLADLVAECGGIMGGVPYMEQGLDDYLTRVFGHAERHGLDLDFHVDELMDPAAATLRRIAETAIARRFPGQIVAGHCCSIALQAPDEVDRTLDLVAQAGIAVVSLPMCNMYLQDRVAARTPRWRGVTLLHEMRARGVRVSVSSDNSRDPFYAYGDMDMVEVYREATRITHLDHPVGDWPAAVSTTPAAVAGFAEARIAAGAPADLVLFRARTFNEFLVRPQSDRVVLRAGRAIDRTLPDYRELDALMGTA